jgi:hypothetical protein
VINQNGRKKTKKKKPECDTRLHFKILCTTKLRENLPAAFPSFQALQEQPVSRAILVLSMAGKLRSKNILSGYQIRRIF